MKKILISIVMACITIGAWADPVTYYTSVEGGNLAFQIVEGTNVKVTKIWQTGDVVIPENVWNKEDNDTKYTVTALGGYLIPDENLATVTGVTIPSTVTSTDEKTFYKCTALTSITFNSAPTISWGFIGQESGWTQEFVSGTTIYAPYTCMKSIKSSFSSYSGSPTYKLINIEFNENTNISEYNQDNIQAKNGTTFTVKRTLHAGYWNTLYLPFDMSWDDLQSNLGSGWKLVEFTGCSESTMTFTQKTSGGADANVPYMIWVPAGYSKTELTITGEPWVKIWGTPATVNPNNAGYCMVGNLNGDNQKVPAGALFIANDKVYKSTGNSPIKAMSAYFTLPANSSNASSFTFEVDGETTGIISIETDGSVKVEEKIYDLQGRRVAQPRHGLYIVNGKKVVRK